MHMLLIHKWGELTATLDSPINVGHNMFLKLTRFLMRSNVGHIIFQPTLNL